MLKNWSNIDKHDACMSLKFHFEQLEPMLENRDFRRTLARLLNGEEIQVGSLTPEIERWIDSCRSWLDAATRQINHMSWGARCALLIAASDLEVYQLNALYVEVVQAFQTRSFRLYADGTMNYEVIANIPGLRCIELCNFTDSHSDFLQKLFEAQQIERVDFKKLSLENLSVSLWSAMAANRHLKEIVGPRASGKYCRAFLGYLANLPELSQITLLDLSSLSLENDAETQELLAAVLRKMPALKTLSLPAGALSKNSPVLSALWEMRLERLTIHNLGIDKHIDAVQLAQALSHLPALSSLNFDESTLTRDNGWGGYKSIRGFSKCFVDQFLKIAEGLQGSPALVSLSINKDCNNNTPHYLTQFFNDEAFRALCDILKTLPRLCYIDLSALRLDFEPMTAASLEALRKLVEEMPQTDIIHYGSNNELRALRQRNFPPLPTIGFCQFLHTKPGTLRINYLPPESFDTLLADLIELEDLVGVDFISNPTNNEEILQLLAALPHLKYLKAPLYDPYLILDNRIFINALRYHFGLESFDFHLSDERIPGEIGGYLARNQFFNQVRKEVAAFLAGEPSDPSNANPNGVGPADAELLDSTRFGQLAIDLSRKVEQAHKQIFSLLNTADEYASAKIDACVKEFCGLRFKLFDHTFALLTQPEKNTIKIREDFMVAIRCLVSQEGLCPVEDPQQKQTFDMYLWELAKGSIDLQSLKNLDLSREEQISLLLDIFIAELRQKMIVSSSAGSSSPVLTQGFFAPGSTSGDKAETAAAATVVSELKDKLALFDELRTNASVLPDVEAFGELFIGLEKEVNRLLARAAQEDGRVGLAPGW